MNFYTQTGWAGKKYESTKGLYGKDLTKLIREDLKIEFPKCKFSIKKDSGTLYMAIDITIKENISGLTDSELKTKVKEIANDYNYDDSDGQVDYFDTRFYLDVKMGV